jgi:hypothetical protein
MCLDGKKHSLIEVFRESSPYGDMDADSVVRWCYECGAIVVDSEVDGRTLPGDVFAMRRPNNFVKTEKTETGVNR